MTTYIVLQKRGMVARGSTATASTEGESYIVLGSEVASGPEQALRKIVGAEARSGSFVAIPLRNWTIIEAKIEQPAPRMVLHEVEFVPGQMTVEELAAEVEGDDDDEPGS